MTHASTPSEPVRPAPRPPRPGDAPDAAAPPDTPLRRGFARVAVCCPVVRLADPGANVAAVLDLARQCHARSVSVAVFPELALSGYSIDDLLMQDVLLDAVEAAVLELLDASTGLDPVLLVGAPLRHGNRIWNTALVMHRGELLGVVPKSYLPTYREFYEARQTAAGAGQRGLIRIGPVEAPFGDDLLFEAVDVRGLVLHAEVCEDMWVPVPPSAIAALAGATVLANLSGSPITIGRADERRLLVQSASSRCLAAYAYAAAGAGESTTDVSWDGQLMLYENGRLLTEGERFRSTAQWRMADVDLDLLRQERLRMGTFDDNRRAHAARTDAFRRVRFRLAPTPAAAVVPLCRPLDRFPFVPDDPLRLDQDCYEAYAIQVAGLEQRLRATGTRRVVIGVSGGLDSTQALIVAARAFDLLGLPRSDILTVTMPGFATGTESKSMALDLMQRLGTTGSELDIRPAARQMLADLDHPFAHGQPVHDTTFENVQAGLRTDYLFRLANHRGGIVIGTGDLSELALGWCTYGVGDQMSHYGVNAGVPKTLIQHLIRWIIRSGPFDAAVDETLARVVDAEISPELVPATDGRVQSTEALIGPYALHDFFLYHIARLGLTPSRTAYLAWHAWHDAAAGAWPAHYPEHLRRAYDAGQIGHWLRVFLQRFFGFSQFKRSALPNGPKISAGGALSPRGDWRAPSDGNADVWLAELQRNWDAHAQDGTHAPG